jgi:hypothetical protein
MRSMHLMLLLWAALPGTVSAEEIPWRDDIQLPLTLIDYPDQFRPSPRFPTMRQGLDISYALNRVPVLGIQRGFEALFPGNEWLQRGLGIPTAALASMGIGFFTNTWVHEEAHRSVLHRQAIRSRNGFYHPDSWSNGLMPVDQVTDTDLSRLKRNSPADAVRLRSAGIEAQHLLVLRTGDDIMYHDNVGTDWGPFYLGESWMAPAMLMAELSNQLYYNLCASPQSNTITDDENRRTTNVLDRDVSGLDCTAWVYEMRRPDEPYRFRGDHPYGEGVDRYRSMYDLDTEEREWLRQQRWVHLLNFANPHLYGINGIIIDGDGNRWLPQLSAIPTPWGHMVDFRVTARTVDWSGALVLHSGFANKAWYPGIDMMIVDQPLFESILHANLGIGMWMQPVDQRWDAGEPDPGGRAFIDVRIPIIDDFDLMPGIEYKTEGFVPGLVDLDTALIGRFAIVAHLH